MNKFLITLAITGIALAFGCAEAAKTSSSANNAASPATATTASTPAQDKDDAPRITLADAKKDYDAGTAVIVDVRDPNTYNQEHIKGSINIPLGNFENDFNKIPKGRKLIAYCS